MESYYNDCIWQSRIFHVIDSENSDELKVHIAICDGKIFVNGVYHEGLGNKWDGSMGILDARTIIVNDTLVPIPHDIHEAKESSPPDSKVRSGSARRRSSVSSVTSIVSPAIEEKNQSEESKSLQFNRRRLENLIEVSMKKIEKKLKANDGNSPVCTISHGRIYQTFSSNNISTIHYVHAALCNNVIYIDSEPHANLGSQWHGKFGMMHNGRIFINNRKYIEASLLTRTITM